MTADVIEPSRDAHVIPNPDEPPHATGPTCWCQPTISYTDPLHGGRVYVHRRTLDSPRYEDVPEPIATEHDDSGKWGPV